MAVDLNPDAVAAFGMSMAKKKFECHKAMVKVANGLADNVLAMAAEGGDVISLVIFDDGRHSECAMALEVGLDVIADSDTLDHKGGVHEAMSSDANVL